MCSILLSAVREVVDELCESACMFGPTMCAVSPKALMPLLVPLACPGAQWQLFRALQKTAVLWPPGRLAQQLSQLGAASLQRRTISSWPRQQLAGGIA